MYSKFNESEAYFECFVDLLHQWFIQMGDLIRQPRLVDRADLFEQDYGIPLEPITFRIDFNMCRQFSLLDLCSNRCYNHCRAEPVAYVVLDDQHRSCPSLFGTNDG